MRLNFFRLRTRRHELEGEHQPKAKSGSGGESGDRPHGVAPRPGVTTLREPDTQWPSWLSSQTTRVSDRALQAGQTLPVEQEESEESEESDEEESDEPASLPAA
jgi:hypothetical protein